MDVLALATDPERFGAAAGYAAALVARLGGALTALHAAEPAPEPPELACTAVGIAFLRH
jgi:hypothetical protein